MQLFKNAAQLMKQSRNKIGKATQAARKSGARQKAFHQAEFVQNKAAFLKVSAEMEHGCNGNGNDFRVGNFYLNIFAVSARLEKIVNKTVYCNSAIAHIRSSPLFLSG
jgi:hypothetical protein